MNTRFRARLIYRALLLRRRRISIALLALVVGATVASALLTTYTDLEQKMAREFRRYGANLVAGPASSEQTIPSESLAAVEGAGVSAVPFLYVVGKVNDRTAVLAGTDFEKLREFSRSWKLEGEWALQPPTPDPQPPALAGQRVGARPGETVRVSVGDAATQFRVAGVISTGASEDSQLLLPLEQLQQMSGMQGRLSLIQVAAPPEQVEATRNRLAAALPAAEVRVLRPVAESTGRILLKVRGLLFATTALVLMIVGMGVMTTLTAIVLERRKDVGVMKALGATETHIAALFVAESLLLGLAGGLAGYFGGLEVARWIGRSIFQAPVAARLQVLPQVLLVTAAVAIAATLVPLRLVRRVNPAVILKGE